MSEFYQQLTCTHARLEYEFEQDDNNMPFLVSAVCEDCNKEVIDQLPDQIRFDIEDAYLEDNMGVHYNAEAQHEYF